MARNLPAARVPRYDKRLKVAAARAVPSGEMRAVDLAKELGTKDSALRRWAQEYGEMGDAAFPGNGSPKANKDCEIVRPRKKAGELERENGLLKNSGPSWVKAMREVRVHQGA